MSEDNTIQERAIIPALRYRDVPGAIDWLCETFGFSLQSQSKDPDGQIFLANLEFGNSTLIIGSVSDTEFDKLMVQPDQIEGAETQICSLLLEDVEAVFEQARAADAQILTDLEDNYAGGMHFTCCDPEGHVWHVDTSPRRDVVAEPAGAGTLAAGTLQSDDPVAAAYDDQQAIAATSGGIAAVVGEMSTAGIGLSAAAVVAAVVASLFLAFQIGAGSQEADQLQLAAMKTELAEASAQHLNAEKAVQDAQARLAEMKSGKQAAEQSVASLREELNAARLDLKSANFAADEARRELEQEREARDELARSGAEASDGVVVAQRELADARKELEVARASIASTQMELKEMRETGDKLAQSKAVIEEALSKAREKLVSTQAEVEEARSTISKLREEMGQQHALHDASELATSGLKAQFAQLQDKAKIAAEDAARSQRELKGVNDANKELEKQVSAAHLELKRLRAEQQADAHAGAEMKKALADLKGDLSSAERVAQDLRDKLGRERKAQDKLKQDLQTAQQNLEQQRAGAAKADVAVKKQLAGLTEKLGDAERSAQSARASLDAARASNDELTEKLRKSQRELANLKRQHDASLVAIATLRETLSRERASQTLVKKTATRVSVASQTPPGQNGSIATATNASESVSNSGQSADKPGKKNAPAVQVAAIGNASTSGVPPIPVRKSAANASATLPPGSDVVGDDTQTVNKEQDKKRNGPTKQEVRIVQRELSRLGCFNGAADGQWTEAAETALGKFIRRSRHGLPKRMTASRAIKALRASRGKVCQ